MLGNRDWKGFDFMIDNQIHMELPQCATAKVLKWSLGYNQENMNKSRELVLLRRRFTVRGKGRCYMGRSSLARSGLGLRDGGESGTRHSSPTLCLCWDPAACHHCVSSLLMVPCSEGFWYLFIYILKYIIIYSVVFKKKGVDRNSGWV